MNSIFNYDEVLRSYASPNAEIESNDITIETINGKLSNVQNSIFISLYILMYRWNFRIPYKTF